jgi:tight adherence protein B
VSPEILGPTLAGAVVVLLGQALSGGERHALLSRAGAVPALPDQRGVVARVRSRVHGSRHSRHPMGLIAIAILSTGCGLLGFVAAGPAGALAGELTAAWVPRWRRRRREVKRAGLVEGQLADAMDGIAAALRAGMSPSQAIAFACDEGVPPFAERLRDVIRREGLGVPLDESLEQLAREEELDDVRFAVAVLQLQHRVGGDAPAVLDDAVGTLRQRVAAADELRSLTAQTRLSGTILGLLPIGFFLFMSVVSRSEVSGALSSPIGLASVASGLTLDGFAFLWIRHLLRSEG